ncbi:MAG TPA: CsgG/HfaB family protein [Thermoanaerobaculia bacterium]|nr:CsgG/HfaB family protein [Thermoanaerobaculia bacterium]
MGIRSRIRGLACGLVLLAAAWPAAGQGNRAALYEEGEQAQRLIVRLTAANTEGAGILFHADAQYAYGITAKHVVFQQGKAVQGLQALLYAWPGRQLPVAAEGLRFHYQEDLAVFRVDLRPLGKSLQEVLQGIPLEQLGSSEELDPGSGLFTIGHATAGAWISSKSTVPFVRDEGSAFLFNTLCSQGHSGGGVFDDKWRLVGMMIKDESPLCRALRIEPILRIVQGWKLEIGLRPPAGDKPDKGVSKGIRVAIVDFDNRSGRDMPKLGFMAQDHTTTALYTVPGVTLVSRDRLESIQREHQIPGSIQTSAEEASRVGKLLKADVLVTGSILRYDVERRTFEGFGTSALQDTSLMAIGFQILDVESGEVRFSKTFDVERTKQYPKATSAPSQPIDLTSDLLAALLELARNDLRSALSQVAAGKGRAGQFVQVPVTSKPAGADVIVDGTYLGSTPMTLQLTTNSEKEIAIELAGYESWRRRVKVQPGITIDVSLLRR